MRIRTGRARAGYRLIDDVSFGFEAGALRDQSRDVGRLGLFVRYAWDGGEVSISGGVAGDRDGSRDGYGTGNLMLRF